MENNKISFVSKVGNRIPKDVKEYILINFNGYVS